MKRHLKKKSHKKYHLSDQSIVKNKISVVMLFVIGLFFLFFSQPLGKLTPLRVPAHISVITTSEPLALEHVSQSVLGAQSINPVDFIQEINNVRARVGSPPLRLSTVLMEGAKARARVILTHQNFSHQDPYEGIELGTILPKLNYHFIYASENIGMGGLSASDFVNGFMHSTYHRENLLDPRLTETGAAIVEGPYKQYYVNIAVQLFAIPAGLDAYLGYSEKDRQTYEESLSILNKKLLPWVLFTQQLLKNPAYSQPRLARVIRQKYILDTLVSRMRKNEPFGSRDVTLILEYNSLLSS